MYIHRMPWPPAASWSSQTPPDPSVCVEASGVVLPSSACPFSCPYSLSEVYPAPDKNLEKQHFIHVSSGVIMQKYLASYD